jgi:hypothetical protein
MTWMNMLPPFGDDQMPSGPYLTASRAAR